MAEFMFRELRASEIDVRINQIAKSGNGLDLLLYKNARADMAVLDETVTPMGWQREHYECKGNLFCKVGIKGPDGWVWKSDAGAPSNYEGEKGEASDSFKRACTNWGIGRELYTAPRIWVPANKCRITQNSNGRAACYDRFSVAKVVIEAHVIKALAIRNDSTNAVAFVWEDPEHAARREKAQAQPASELYEEDVSF